MKVKTHLMFQGDAEKAVELYSSIFEEFRVENMERYGVNEGAAEGSLKIANISFADHEITVFNSPPIHEFTFTPSMSLFIDFNTRHELENAFDKLSQGGEVLMPPSNYGFSQFYTWTKDPFGVSWQLNLP